MLSFQDDDRVKTVRHCSVWAISQDSVARCSNNLYGKGCEWQHGQCWGQDVLTTWSITPFRRSIFILFIIYLYLNFNYYLFRFMLSDLQKISLSWVLKISLSWVVYCQLTTTFIWAINLGLSTWKQPIFMVSTILEIFGVKETGQWTNSTLSSLSPQVSISSVQL